MFEPNEKVVVMTTRLQKNLYYYLHRYGEENVCRGLAFHEPINLKDVEGVVFEFGAPIDRKVCILVHPNGHLIKFPTILVRSAKDRNFKKGDDVYVHIPPMEEREEHPYFTEDMVEQFTNNCRTTLVDKGLTEGTWRVASDIGHFWTLAEKWISYLPPGAAPKPVKQKDEGEQILRLKKEIRKDFDDFWERNRGRIGENFRCSFGKIVKDGDGTLCKNEAFSAPCHYDLNLKGAACLYLVDFMDVHYGRQRLQPCFDSIQQRNSSFTKAMEYWVNRGPFKRVFKTKSIPEILEHGLEYDTGYHISAIACAAIGLRTFGEFYEKSLVFEKASEKWGEHVAAIVAMCSYYDGEEGFYIAYRNWHDLICADRDAKILYESWVNDDLAVFKVPGKKMNELDHGHYRIHNHLSPYGPHTTMGQVLPNMIQDADDVDEFLHMIESSVFIKEIVNG